jgi:hypothetical protein
VILNSYGGTPVYRLRATTSLDSYGDPAEDWAAPSRVVLPGAVLQRAGRTEDAERDGAAGSMVTVDKAVFVPGRPDLAYTDRIEAEGLVYRVEGEPRVVASLGSGVYTTARLVRFDS